MDALNIVFEIDIEGSFRVKDKADMRQARFHHTAIFDAKHDFIIVIGGMVNNPQGD